MSRSNKIGPKIAPEELHWWPLMNHQPAVTPFTTTLWALALQPVLPSTHWTRSSHSWGTSPEGWCEGQYKKPYYRQMDLSTFIWCSWSLTISASTNEQSLFPHLSVPLSSSFDCPVYLPFSFPFMTTLPQISEEYYFSEENFFWRYIFKELYFEMLKVLLIGKQFH